MRTLNFLLVFGTLFVEKMLALAANAALDISLGIIPIGPESLTYFGKGPGRTSIVFIAWVV